MKIKVKCPFNPIIYRNSPIGMFHCPWCNQMVMAGEEHLEYPEIFLDEDEYLELVENMNQLLKKFYLRI